MQLSKTELSKKEMAFIKGGAESCGCGCNYAESGGSSIESNGAANNSKGQSSSEYRYVYLKSGTVLDLGMIVVE